MNGYEHNITHDSSISEESEGTWSAFLGRGWSFPPVLTDRGIRMSSYEQDIRESLHVLLSTSPGERVNRYEYGSPLRCYTFEPLTVQTSIRMREDIARAIALYEPRITPEDISFEEQPEKGLLMIQLKYTVILTNNRNNMVYPFYINEGTTINNV